MGQILADVRQGTEDPRLAEPILSGYPEHLSFSDHVRRLDP
jgi:hypothetical protein